MAWVPAPIPSDDVARLSVLHELGVLDSEPEESFDAIVRLAASICGVPIALVSLVDEHRQWFKARFGLEPTETPRDISFCGHAIAHDETLVVPDASLDPRFHDNPLRVGGPHVEFYAGVPLRTASGHNVGTLCVIDHVPRALTDAQQRALEALAVQVTRLLELRRSSAAQRKTIASLRATEASLRKGMRSIPASEAPRRSRWVLLVALALALASAATSFWVQASLDETGRGRIAQAAQRVEHLLAERIKVYSEITRSIGALYAASDNVSGAEFDAFASSLDLAANYPGLLGIGFIERVERAALGAWLPVTLRDDPDFRLRSDQEGPVLALNRRIAPHAPNRAALGFDAFGEPVRRRTLLLASKSGDVVMTPRVTLLQDPERGPGYLLYVAVQNKQRAVSPGWALAVLRANDLIAGLDQAAGPGIDLRIEDGTDSTPLLDGNFAGPRSLKRVVSGAAHAFTLTLSPGLGFKTLSEDVASPTVFLLGVGAALLLALLGRAMQNIEERSRKLARNMTSALRRSESELRAVIDGTSDFVVTFDHEQRLVLVNRAFREMLQYEDAQAEGLRLNDVVEDVQRAAFERELEVACALGGQRRIETTFVSKSGSRFAVEGTVSSEPDDEFGLSHAIFRDVTARRQAEEALVAANAALAQLATTDALTGAANRRLFDERLAEETARAVRHGTPLSLVLIDIDHFKLYNDRYGHAGGDDCLRKVASCIRSHARRGGEVAARYGGEEFGLILPGADADAAFVLAERLRTALAELAIPHDRHPLGYVTASFGVAQVEALVITPGMLIESADAALYRAKAAGRHRVAC